MTKSKLLLDANVFITAHQSYYSPEICPGFWKALEKAHGQNTLCSIDKVYNELCDFGDSLSDWTKSLPQTFFKQTQDHSVVSLFTDLVSWVTTSSDFTPAAKSEFADSADAWLIAYAKSNGLTLVTLESYDPNCRRRVKIPNVCEEFGVATIDTFEMLESLKFSFYLRSKNTSKSG